MKVVVFLVLASLSLLAGSSACGRDAPSVADAGTMDSSASVDGGGSADAGGASDGGTPDAGDCAISFSPSPLNFGAVAVGVTAVATLSVVNSGTGACTIAGMSFTCTGACPYRLLGRLSLPATLQAAQSLNVAVSYAPFDGGPTADTLVVTYMPWPPDPDVPAKIALESVDGG